MATRRTDILESKEDIERWVAEKKSKAFICKQLQCKPLTLDCYLKKMKIDYRGNKSGSGYPKEGKKTSVYDYLNDRKPITSFKLKNKLIASGIKEAKCEHCGRTTWLGSPIALELHHINGKDYDNHLENLQLLCPNCHALTDNYRGKAKKRRL